MTTKAARLTALALVLIATCSTPVNSVAASAPGRIYGATGVAWGGIFMMNLDGKNGISLSANTWGTNTKTENNSKSDAPSVSMNGLVAFASDRDGSGMRVYVMKSDGTAIKQLTFGKDAAMGAHDVNPTISPDGKWVAFVSRRSGGATTPPSGAQDVFVVSTSGGALRQLTRSETDGRADSYIRIVVWSPDSKKIAYRGNRAVTDSSGNAFVRDVLGFIDPVSGQESKILIGDCAGGGVLDWVGTTLLYSYGGNVQGCPGTRYIVRDVVTESAKEIPMDKTPGVSQQPGQARLSPDGRRVAYTYADTFKTYLATVGIDGSDFTQAATGAVVPGSWLWWAAGTAISTPAKLTVTSTISIKRGSKPVQITPVLSDKNKKVIARAAQDWTWNLRPGGGVSISADGLLRVAKDAGIGTYRVTVVNAGKSAKVKIVVR